MNVADNLCAKDLSPMVNSSKIPTSRESIGRGASPAR
jgi:hypothetical protein